jgi:hypothetical protein
MAKGAIAAVLLLTPARGAALRVLALFVFAAAFILPAAAQPADKDPMSAKLSAERIGDVETGDYSAGDTLRFTLAPYGDKFLLRYSDSPEVFVLYPDRAALGGRVLKYDSSVILIKVSVWGGMTIYTDKAPDGLPTTRTGDPASLVHAPVSPAAIAGAMNEETAMLASSRKLQVGFTIDAIPTDSWIRAMAYDTLINTAMGIARFTAAATGHDLVARKIGDVKVVVGAKPIISLAGRTLIVTYVPAQGYAGRASSRAIARALGKLFELRP